MRSIVSNNKKCFICGTTRDLHKHHIYYGMSNRRLSEKYGCWLWLCVHHHVLGPGAVHENKDLDLKLKKLCQVKWEELGIGSREEFMRTFGRNYL